MTNSLTASENMSITEPAASPRKLIVTSCETNACDWVSMIVMATKEFTSSSAMITSNSSKTSCASLKSHPINTMDATRLNAATVDRNCLVVIITEHQVYALTNRWLNIVVDASLLQTHGQAERDDREELEALQAFVEPGVPVGRRREHPRARHVERRRSGVDDAQIKQKCDP